MTVLVSEGLEPSLRAEFAELCLEVGPDAPTLCEGWTTRDLAIHLVLIERRWDSWLAIPVWSRVAPIDRAYDRLVERERSRPWGELVDRVRTGPKFGPLSTQWLRDRMMPREYIIHTEDVRRANGIDVTATVDVQRVAWNRLAGLAKRMISVSDPYGLELSDLMASTMSLRAGDPTAMLTGAPLELLLHVFGRTTASVTEWTGDPDAIDAVQIRNTGSAFQSLPRVSI